MRHMDVVYQMHPYLDTELNLHLTLLTMLKQYLQKLLNSCFLFLGDKI